MLNPIEGEIFYIDKPLKWTSFEVVKKVRARLRKRLDIKSLRVGHAGTLDPLATGVLTVCTGRATKRIEELQAGVKEYIAHIRLGETTPSFDLETEVDATYPWQHITREQVEKVLQEQFTGTIEQVPPAFSACKIDGKPAYKLARKGREVEIRPKTLVIDEIELLECGLPQEPTITIRVVCSKGTYIRALARDIGEALDSGAHLTALRRTRIGDITVDQCMTVENLLNMLETEDMVSPDRAEQERLERERENNRAMARARKAETQARQRARKPRQSQL
ncbi:MAG: tRNA pseudouridine(55) synthase TruB [Muribaculaceae bacterium]|nr:tRNA pseudouridine(55) synthase TruB [Muribaculaceae bacterium]MBR0023985.1 tRNA pseudouridine(55) synthase TruB [Muribaculaceae bacterium]